MKLTLTQKKIAAVSAAVVACLAAFNILTPDRAAAVVTVVAALAALYTPKKGHK